MQLKIAVKPYKFNQYAKQENVLTGICELAHVQKLFPGLVPSELDASLRNNIITKRKAWNLHGVSGM